MSAFSLSSLLLCLSSIVFSAIVYRSDNKNPINRSWFMFSIAFSIWALSLFIVTSTESLEVATAWQYALDISAVFIPLLYLRFAFALIQVRAKVFMAFAWVTALAIAALSATPLFKAGMAQQFEFYWVQPGPYYYVFPIYFGVGVITAFGCLIWAYAKSKDKPLLRAQIRNTILSGTIGYIGGFTNFFPQIFNIYPFGNYLIIGYIIFMVYGVLKYKLLSAKVVSAQLFSTALLLVLLFNILRSERLEEWMTSFAVFILAGFLSLLLIRSVRKEVTARLEVEKLADDLAHANEELKQVDKQKTEFVSLASHQLRGPLTAIKGYGSMLLEGDFGTLEPTVRDAVEKMYKSTQDLVIIVSDYLDVSRIEQGRMQYDFSNFDLAELVTSIANELKPNVDGAHLTLDVDITPLPGRRPYLINADMGKIKQVTINIIDNSIKYTPAGGIHIWVAPRPGHAVHGQQHTNGHTNGKALISISDTGVGIHPDVLPKLFAKFTRAPDASKTNILGTGLGLYVARKMIEAHNGRIWAESAGTGKGATFFIELDLA